MTNLTDYQHKWVCCQGLAQSLIEVAHWTFAIKYWCLSFKIQLMIDNRDPDIHNKKFWVLHIIGLLLNLSVGGVYIYALWFPDR